MSQTEDRGKLGAAQLAPTSPQDDRELEKKTYIQSLSLKNSSGAPNEDRIRAVAQHNEDVQFERIGVLFDDVSRHYNNP